jgi:hypothetical protein
VGTLTAFGRAAPSRRTRTNWPGLSAPSGLGTSASASTVPVLPDTRVSENTSLPFIGCTLPSARCTSTSNAPCAGSFSWPAATSPRQRIWSVSAMPKRSLIGSVCVTVVSSTCEPETSVPSDTWERPTSPPIGASTRVYCTLSAASARRACAPFRSARAICSLDAASSCSRWLTARPSHSGFRRLSVRVACARRASEPATSASALARAAWNGATSSVYSDWPFFTLPPSAKLRLMRMPDTRARTSASREPAVWPTYS